MNFDSPSNLVKNIQGSFFANHHHHHHHLSHNHDQDPIQIHSPDSPSNLPKHSRASSNSSKVKSSRPKPIVPLATRNLNKLFDINKKFNSPTSTLAADLSENFHIEEYLNNQKPVPTPKRNLNFNQQRKQLMALQDAFDYDDDTQHILDGIDEVSDSPLLNKQLETQQQTPLDKTFERPKSSQLARPSFLNHSSHSSRTTSNASISSINSTTSVSSAESNFSMNTATLPTSSTTSLGSISFVNSKKSLRRARTSIAGNMRFLHSNTTSNIELSTSRYNIDSDDFITNSYRNNLHSQDDEDEDDDLLDKFCVPSPIAERSFTLEQEQINEKDDENDDDYEPFSGINKREIGSPIQKKPIRSKVRRIHSMFYSKKEITDTAHLFGNLMNTSPSDKLNDDDDSVLSNSILQRSKIETFHVKNDFIPRIKVETLCKILDGQYKQFFDEVTIVDCRFEYEYRGGHIQGAVNVSSQQELEEKFLYNRSEEKLQKNFGKRINKLIVFHCEFSSYRGPLMASHLRTCDRNINQDNYPHLDYPDILVLEGGYKNFFNLQSKRCFPQKYVEMNDDKHKNACEKELNRFKRDLKRASSFNSLSFTASLNSSSSSINTSTTTTTSTTTSSSNSSTANVHRLHRRTLTSGAINFSRRPSLKNQFLESQRSTNEIFTTSTNDILSDDDTKPPESFNFGFKFPTKISNNKIPTSPTSFNDDDNLNPKEILRKKLSRSFTVSS